ncbi:PucR family transcriptional regulator [Aeromicrobium piscarium]|uniref:PucR family transcriptional regulator n=1 Tax=Aeromicrobium piscarium TaxID=2590901 RepID=A0A554S8M1_9ACTN|nr:helix-turn-helix domain-containing protein [Aeromicrobium piscarium]TSD62700.1 PucR family transcriptional regulator [Aeromicrobium piscarium]
MTHAEDDLARAARRVGDAIPRLAREVIDDYAAGAPRFAEAGMPEHLSRESTHTVRTILRVGVAAMTDPDPPRQTAVREVIERSADRVAEGLPLGEYLRCWHIAFEHFAAVVRAEIDDDTRAWPVVERTRTIFDAMLRAVADAYDLAGRDLAAASSGHDAEIIRALFSGAGWTFEDPGAVPERPLVVLVHVGAAPGEDAPSPLTRSTARLRKVRLLRAHLVRELADLWLIDLDDTSGRLLLRTPPSDPERLLADMARIGGAPVTIAAEPATGVDDLPRASALAAEALAAAVHHGGGGQWVTMADVAVEHHLSHDSVSRPLLLERCRGMLEREELLSTLRSFVAHDLDRRATARDLFVHPNTVDNRLARIKTLTGLDVHSTRDLVTLVIAALSDDSDGQDAVIWSQSPAGSPVLPDA